MGEMVGWDREGCEEDVSVRSAVGRFLGIIQTSQSRLPLEGLPGLSIPKLPEISGVCVTRLPTAVSTLHQVDASLNKLHWLAKRRHQ